MSVRDVCSPGQNGNHHLRAEPVLLLRSRNVGLTCFQQHRNVSRREYHREHNDRNLNAQISKRREDRTQPDQKTHADRGITNVQNPTSMPLLKMIGDILEATA